MTKPLISVIVPVYLAEKYLDKCISSIVNQTYTDLEIIIIDDGSPDNCPSICDKWALKDERIKVIHKENAGVSAARNDGIDLAKGEYIAFIDADDWVEKEYLESLLSAMNDELDVVSAGFSYDHIDDETEELHIKDIEYIEENIVREFLLDNIRPEACGKLIRKEAVINTRFDCKHKYSEDLLFCYYTFKNCKRIACVDNTMYHYLQDSGNSSTTPLITVNRKNSYKVFEEIVDDCKEDENLYFAALYQYTMRVFAILTRVLKDKDFAKQFYDEIANAILSHKKELLSCGIISKKYKISIIVMSISKKLFKALFLKLF